MTIRRFTDGRSHKGGVGMPAVTEHPQGEYVRYADHVEAITLLELENKIWRGRTKRAEEKKCKCEN